MTSADMAYRRMGKSGLTLSALSLGGWTTYGASVRDDKLVESIIHRAFERGVNFFDIADVYERGEAERAMGRVFAGMKRHELVISSKVFWPLSDDINDKGLSRKHIFESVHKSLKRIGTDYLDLYFCHRPDPSTPIEETVRAMDDLVHQGKVLYWGTSEHEAAQLRSIAGLCHSRGYYAPAVEQPQLSLVKRERFLGDVSPAATELGMGLVTWSPLASGLLSGKYDQDLPEGSRLRRSENLRSSYLTEENRGRVRELKPLAAEAGCTRAQLAIAWCLAQPGVTSVITGASTVAQLEDNLGALKVNLSAALRGRIEALFVEH